MARNLLKQGRVVTVFDVVPASVKALVSAGASSAASVKELAKGIMLCIGLTIFICRCTSLLYEYTSCRHVSDLYFILRLMFNVFSMVVI